MGYLLRFSSFLALVAAVFAGTIDSIRSISESAPVLTPLGTAIASINASGTVLVETIERPGGWPDSSWAAFEPALRWILQQPAFAMLLVLALLFWIIGYRRPAAHRFGS